MTTTPILEARGLVKRYGHVTALGGSDFDLMPGEILAVIGDNGAGKSSLIKCLSGAVVPDEGEILLDGQAVEMKTPLDARALGIETVYQTLAVSPALDIAETVKWKETIVGKLNSGVRSCANRSALRSATRNTHWSRPQLESKLHGRRGTWLRERSRLPRKSKPWVPVRPTKP